MTVRTPPLAMRLLADLTKPEPLLKRRMTPLEFLTEVVHDETLPLGTRLRAAIEAAPYCHPKLSAQAVLHARGDFAERLERAITRSAMVIEHSPSGEHDE